MPLAWVPVYTYKWSHIASLEILHPMMMMIIIILFCSQDLYLVIPPSRYRTRQYDLEPYKIKYPKGCHVKQHVYKHLSYK
jgi:membrane protein YdbS with pleckstrin-like domain